jgi:hypothetical protein
VTAKPCASQKRGLTIGKLLFFNVFYKMERKSAIFFCIYIHSDFQWFEDMTGGKNQGLIRETTRVKSLTFRRLLFVVKQSSFRYTLF